MNASTHILDSKSFTGANLTNLSNGKTALLVKLITGERIDNVYLDRFISAKGKKCMFHDAKSAIFIPLDDKPYLMNGEYLIELENIESITY